MNDSATRQVGSDAFWDFYDKFCAHEHLKEFITTGKSQLAPLMKQIIEASHIEKGIYNISRPSRQWVKQKAWLAIRNATILNDEGRYGTFVRAGDVMYINHGWDRDVVITHSPPLEDVSGYLLSGRWPDMVGLFMPLFDLQTVHECIRLRLKKNEEECLYKAAEELSE